MRIQPLRFYFNTEKQNSANAQGSRCTLHPHMVLLILQEAGTQIFDLKTSRRQGDPMPPLQASATSFPLLIFIELQPIQMSNPCLRGPRPTSFCAPPMEALPFIYLFFKEVVISLSYHIPGVFKSKTPPIKESLLRNLHISYYLIYHQSFLSSVWVWDFSATESSLVLLLL